MHSNHPFFPDPGKPMQPYTDQLGYYMQNAPMASFFNRGFMPPTVEPFMPFHNVYVQPSDACPKNLVIFDQTNQTSQIMFHPEINSSFFYPNSGVDTIFQDNFHQRDANAENKISSPFKEDSDYIDALLATEDDEIEECEDDEVISTARTDAFYRCNSSDSCSNYESPSKIGSIFKKSSESRYKGKKRERMRKMVKALKGIVPNAARMSTVAVLDEAVRYLKSLKMDMKKLGVRNSKV